jgi:two-component system cell cycle sensor histidine kinase/response regulator CckA
VESGGKGKILVVDDDAAICSLLSDMFSDSYQVDTVACAQEALARFRPGLYDVAVTDLSLPTMRGDKLAREVTRIDPSVVAVLLTGWSYLKDDTDVEASISWSKSPST